MTLLYSWGWETPIRKTCSDLSKVKWKFKNINILRSNMRKSEVPPEVKWLDIETKKVSRNFFYICLDFIFANVLQINSLERNSIVCWKIFPFMQLFPPQKALLGRGQFWFIITEYTSRSSTMGNGTLTFSLFAIFLAISLL